MPDAYIPPPTPSRTSTGCLVALVIGVALLLMVIVCGVGLTRFYYVQLQSVPDPVFQPVPAPQLPQPAPVPSPVPLPVEQPSGDEPK